ncbi:hypothetical protein KC669_01115 [Candidatus Dojkabacteria bacterium]|uniref:Uncharacterized protein n=1 Tax=Candidatus Dojkabacteria bacterium TaxID=2099670 RepID=A0A955L9I0_9BACT|nr:hypothetical protein [Candidatus Dojkabacteria bacterium]
MDQESRELHTRLAKKAYTLVILFALAFGLPAVIAGLLGKYFDEQYGVNGLRTLSFLGVSYIVGWFVVVLIYKYYKKKIRKDE